MDWINHNVKIGEIISSEGEQVAIADSHEIRPIPLTSHGLRPGTDTIEVGKATIRILSGCQNVICTNSMNIRGLVCFLPAEFKGCAILKVKITLTHNKSVEAIPIDYIKADRPFEFFQYGNSATVLLAQDTDYPNIQRIRA